MAQRWPRGPMNDWHRAAATSAERVEAVLSTTEINIDLGDGEGYTPLMISSDHGNSRAVEILLSKGANVAITKDGDLTALHFAANEGHVVVARC